jgi:hypothetical protein
MSVSVKSQDLGEAARQENKKKKKIEDGSGKQSDVQRPSKSGAMRSEAWDRKASKSISLALLGLRVAQGQSGSR